MGNRFIVKQDWKVNGTTFKKNTQFTIIMGMLYMDGYVLSDSWQKVIYEAIKNDLKNGGKNILADRTDF